jgi:hypothetical protein
MSAYTKDQLVEQPAIQLFAELGWQVATTHPHPGPLPSGEGVVELHPRPGPVPAGEYVCETHVAPEKKPACVHEMCYVHVVMNRQLIVNTSQKLGGSLEKALAEKLRSLLAGVSWLHGWQVERMTGAADWGFDILVKVPLPGGGKAALCVECKSEMRPSVFRMAADRNFSPPGRPQVVVPVLAMPFVSPRVAELCVAHGWSWFDLAGNCRLDVPRVFLLERRGNEPVHARPRASANLSTPEAARVLRALLAPENATTRWTQRAMVAHFGQLQLPVTPPSLALVNKVVQHLRDEAFIEVQPEGGFRLRDPLGLLAAWRAAYRFGRHQRRGYFTLLQGMRLHETLVSLENQTGGHAVYAAFSAANLQAPHVRQPKTWLFVGAEYEDEFCATVEAKQVDSGENIVLLIPNDEGVFYLPESKTGQLPCSNAVQTYLDLIHSKGRGEEAAEALLEQKLKPAWKGGGLL